MPWNIEIISVGGKFDDHIAEAKQLLNGVQDEFRFSLAPMRLRGYGVNFVQSEYHTHEVFKILKKYQDHAKGMRPYLIAVLDTELSGVKYNNLFGSHEAEEGLAVITLRDHRVFTESARLYLCYYFIRYALSFVCPELKNHEDTRDCFFDRKSKKRDLQYSLKSGKLCKKCHTAIYAKLNDEENAAIANMVKMLKTVPERSSETFPAASLKGQIDIGIITIREDEFEAVLDRFPLRREVDGTGSNYSYSSVQTKMNESLRVAVTRSPQQGQTFAQAIAFAMINDLAPKWIFLVGIAGGFASSEHTLGDVLLSQRMHDFSVTAALEGKESEFQDMGGPMTLEVEKLVKDLRAKKAKLTSWNTPSVIRQAKPKEKVPDSVTSKKLYGELAWRKKVLKSLQGHFPKRGQLREPDFFAATLITSNTLVKDTKLASTWRKTARQAAGVEMELAGVCAAARYGADGTTRVIAIRGISDIVGYDRDPAWTQYACHSAAAFAHALIISGLIRR
jgi:nucleoside phosphorylase